MLIARRFACFLESVRGVNLCLRQLKKGNAMTIEFMLSTTQRLTIKNALLIAAVHVAQGMSTATAVECEIDQKAIDDFVELKSWIEINEMCALSSMETQPC